MKSYTQLAGDSKAANRRPQAPSNLDWHKTPTRELLEAALKLEDANARYTLLTIVMVANITNPLPPVTNVKWWKGALGIPAQRWKRDLSTLINARLVSVRCGLISTTFSHVCCNKVGSSEPNSRAEPTASPHLHSTSRSHSLSYPHKRPFLEESTLDAGPRFDAGDVYADDWKGGVQ
jgi:hypothetical protein